jgi:hypothetical protein
MLFQRRARPGATDPADPNGIPDAAELVGVVAFEAARFGIAAVHIQRVTLAEDPAPEPSVCPPLGQRTRARKNFPIRSVASAASGVPSMSW